MIIIKKRYIKQVKQWMWWLCIVQQVVGQHIQIPSDFGGLELCRRVAHVNPLFFHRTFVWYLYTLPLPVPHEYSLTMNRLAASNFLQSWINIMVLNVGSSSWVFHANVRRFSPYFYYDYYPQVLCVTEHCTTVNKDKRIQYCISQEFIMFIMIFSTLTYSNILFTF